MARIVGKQVRLFFGAFERSSDSNKFDQNLQCDVEDVTTYASGGWHEFQATLKSFDFTFDAFYQSGVGTIGDQLTSLLGLTEIATVCLNEATAIGDNAFLFGPALLTKNATSTTVPNLVKQVATLKGVGRGGYQGPQLHVAGAETGAGNSTAVDNAALTSNGGRGNIHVTAITGAATIKIQHSVDNVTFADLITFSPTVVGALTLEVAGTVNRYLRDVHTPGTTITYASFFSRY